MRGSGVLREFTVATEVSPLLASHWTMCMDVPAAHVSQIGMIEKAFQWENNRATGACVDKKEGHLPSYPLATASPQAWRAHGSCPGTCPAR